MAETISDLNARTPTWRMDRSSPPLFPSPDPPSPSSAEATSLPSSPLSRHSRSFVVTPKIQVIPTSPTARSPVGTASPMPIVTDLPAAASAGAVTLATAPTTVDAYRARVNELMSQFQRPAVDFEKESRKKMSKEDRRKERERLRVLARIEKRAEEERKQFLRPGMSPGKHSHGRRGSPFGSPRSKSSGKARFDTSVRSHTRGTLSSSSPSLHPCDTMSNTSFLVDLGGTLPPGPFSGGSPALATSSTVLRPTSGGTAQVLASRRGSSSPTTTRGNKNFFVATPPFLNTSLLSNSDTGGSAQAMAAVAAAAMALASPRPKKKAISPDSLRQLYRKRDLLDQPDRLVEPVVPDSALLNSTVHEDYSPSSLSHQCLVERRMSTTSRQYGKKELRAAEKSWLANATPVKAQPKEKDGRGLLSPKTPNTANRTNVNSPMTGGTAGGCDSKKTVTVRMAVAQPVITASRDPANSLRRHTERCGIGGREPQLHPPDQHKILYPTTPRNPLGSELPIAGCFSFQSDDVQ